MPGTWGTIGAFCAALFLQKCPVSILYFMTILLTLLGIYVSDLCLKQTQCINMDPSWIVIDEVAGYFWTLSILSLFHPLNFIMLVVAFVFFRLFDIMKPWPISWVDQSMSESPKTAALGIMLDDVMAGVFAAFFTLFACRIIFN
jgi:phosphatidylglycerophosphatase A